MHATDTKLCGKKAWSTDMAKDGKLVPNNIKKDRGGKNNKIVDPVFPIYHFLFHVLSTVPCGYLHCQLI